MCTPSSNECSSCLLNNNILFLILFSFLTMCITSRTRTIRMLPFLLRRVGKRCENWLVPVMCGIEAWLSHCGHSPGSTYDRPLSTILKHHERILIMPSAIFTTINLESPFTNVVGYKHGDSPRTSLAVVKDHPGASLTTTPALPRYWGAAREIVCK